MRRHHDHRADGHGGRRAGPGDRLHPGWTRRGGPVIPAPQGPPAFAVGDDGTLAIADPRAPEVVVAAAGRPPRRVSTAPGISALWPAGAAVAIARSEGTVSVLPAQGSERLVAGFAPAGGIDFDGRAFLVARGRCDGTEIVRIPVGPRPDLQRVDRCPPLLLDARLGTDGRLVLRFGCTRLVPSRSSDRCRLRVAVPGFGSARRAVGPGAVAILRLPRPGRRSTRHLRVTAASTTRGGTLRRTFRIRPSLNP